ncbi:RnfABCDGE type electron transport complex subunit D [Virgibacillus dokdonensis]|uniref:RnfABCDGE type electron transport complex subunit D n=1 Tax=Virgibacillus dokdonensis TaxID=302167 RepID=UPI00098A662E|nr:RnfABCDGE type electron transport complex subunit D [Virgibacillus dokdonensis]
MTKFKAVIDWGDYKIDPRYCIILFLGAFIIAGQTYLNFQQGIPQVIASIVTTVTTEIILGKLILKKWIYPLSPLITGMGLSLLLSSNLIWPYILAGFLSIVFKYVLRFKGSHIFNPNNIAVVFMITLLPSYVLISPKQWSNGYLMMFIILILGIIVVIIAKRLAITLTFIISFMIIGILRHFIFGAPLLVALGPIMGASMQLFFFFMVTDPKTTPNSRKDQIYFGIVVAILDGVLRLYRIPFAPFYALFLTSIVFMIPYRYLINRRVLKEGEI